MQPYFYKIQEITTGRFYVGCQYGAGSTPDNLWKTYFTSCKYIKNGNKENFKVIYVKARPDAKDYEKRYISKMFRLLGREVFERRFINRNLAPGVLYTQEVRQKMSDGIKKSVARRKAEGAYKPTFLGRRHSDQTKKILSDQKKKLYENGYVNPKGMLGKNHSDEVKVRIQNTAKRKSAMRGRLGDEHPTGGTRWWNNGSAHKRCAESPGNGWVEGRMFKVRKRKKQNAVL